MSAAPASQGGGTTVVVTHHATTGPSDALEEYLRTRRHRLVVLEHGFEAATASGSKLRVWEDGMLLRERRFPWSARFPGPVTWLKDAILTLALVPRAAGRAGAVEYIGIDSLNATVGLLLRRLGRVRSVVFWTIDYAPDRFGNRLLNGVYFALDRVCVTRCDETWNVSPRMEEARARRRVRGPQRIVPMGAYVRAPARPAEPHRIVHMGSLLAKQGVQVGIAALVLVRVTVPDARLLVIGGGPYRPQLESLAKRLGVEASVEFAGFVADHDEVERLIAESGVALATYDPAQADFSYFADPGKVKNYLAAGVPVVATDVPWSASWLARHGAGIVVEYRADAVARGILELLDNEAARGAAARLGRELDWDGVFDAAFAGRREP